MLRLRLRKSEGDKGIKIRFFHKKWVCIKIYTYPFYICYQMNVTHLIDNNARFYLFQTLQKCHENRVQLYTFALNVIVFLVFVLVTGSILYYNYKNKLTDEELQEKMFRDQQYILSKIRYYQAENQKRNTSDITSLPMI